MGPTEKAVSNSSRLNAESMEALFYGRNFYVSLLCKSLSFRETTLCPQLILRVMTFFCFATSEQQTKLLSKGQFLTRKLFYDEATQEESCQQRGKEKRYIANARCIPDEEKN